MFRLAPNSCTRLTALSQYGLRYSRQYFEDLNIDTDAIQREQDRQDRQEKATALLRYFD